MINAGRMRRVKISNMKEDIKRLCQIEKELTCSKITKKMLKKERDGQIISKEVVLGILKEIEIEE